MAKVVDQAARDKKRVTYRLQFPSDLDPERVTAWLRSISGTLRTGGFRFMQGAPSLVLETWATNLGIEWRLKVPWSYEPYIRPSLESLVPGIRLTPEAESPSRVWVHAVEAGLKDKDRQLRIPNASDLSTSILANFSALSNDETLMMQWVVAPAAIEHKPIFQPNRTGDVSFKSVFMPSNMTRDEVEDRRQKLDEPGMFIALRVGAVASTKVRAQFMVRGVMASLDSSRGPATHFYKRMVTEESLQQRITHAVTPMQWAAKLSAPELTAALAWPIGNPSVAGLPAAVSRYLPTPELVPRTGRVLGVSTFPGRERRVAVSYDESLKHVHVLGGTGSGKTALLANMIKQDMKAGKGVVLIESKGDLFRQALDYVPPERINDVIVFDVNDETMPVGFNILQQGDPATMVDELNMVFNALFKDHPSLWMQEVMYYGLRTLVLDKKATFVDLAGLVSPNAEDMEWREQLIRNVQDPQVRNFWKRFENQGRTRQDQKAEPLMSRVWPMTRSKLMNIVGQSESSFYMDDVVKDNKILLVNLSGIERGSATIMGTLLLNYLWNSVKRFHSQKGMYLYLDEFHHYMNIPVDLEQMLVESRSMGLGMVLAHQFLRQLSSEDMKAAIKSNAKTKVAFQLDHDDANEMARAFGGSITATDLNSLAKYESVARISTAGGISPPLTMQTLPPATIYGKAKQVRYVSRQQYGRPISRVQEEIVNRHNVTGTDKMARRPSTEGWAGL